MSKLLYMLEDHFDALAERKRGFAGGISKGLRTIFAFAGDVMRAPVERFHKFQ